MHIDYFFDPVCPYCWMTSKWLRQVVPHRALVVDWRFISLRVINDGTYEGRQPALERHTKGLELLRVVAAAKDEHGVAAAGGLYQALGTGIWETDRRKHPDNVVLYGADDEIERALEDAGLPAELASARADGSWDITITADSNLALERTGRDVGTPIITFRAPDGPSLFGPVISTVPELDRSLAIWDALVTLTDHPDFAEIKRSERSKLDLPVYK